MHGALGRMDTLDRTDWAAMSAGARVRACVQNKLRLIRILSYITEEQQVVNNGVDLPFWPPAWQTLWPGDARCLVLHR